MGVRMGSPGGSDAHPAFPGGRGGSVWATPASIIIAAFIVSGSLWTGPSSSPSLMRVRRDVDDQMFPGEDESTDLDLDSLSEDQTLGYLGRNNRWHWVWKHFQKREALEVENNKVPQNKKARTPRVTRNGAEQQGPEKVHVSYSQTNWCGLTYCHYSNLDAALYALHSLLTNGIEKVAMRMESSQTSAEDVGKRVADELKFAGNQIELMVQELTNVKKSALREGTENHDTWRALGDQLKAIELATKDIAKQMEEHTRGEEAALAEVAAVVQTTGNAIAAGTANIVSQIAGSSDAEAKAINGISQDVKVVATELERHNSERKKEATASNDNLEEATRVLKNGLERSAGLVAYEIEALSSNMTSDVHAVRSGIEGIPRQIGHLAGYLRENFGDNLAAIDKTLKTSFSETNMHLQELPNVRFDVIEAALADINKDFTSTLEIEGEKLRNSIKDHGQELRVKKLHHPELSQDWQTAGVLERYFKQIVDQNREASTDQKLELATDQIKELRSQLNENKNFNKLAAGNKELYNGLDGLQQTLARNSELGYMRSQLNNLNVEGRSLNNKDAAWWMLLQNQNENRK